jgi:imidazolonepropionase-like amidohydrolase
MMFRNRLSTLLTLGLLLTTAAAQDIAVRGKAVYTMAGDPISDGVVLIEDGKIAAVGPAGSVKIPAGVKTLEAAIVTPGLIDAHCTIGLSGIFNQKHDQDQLERSEPIQPELRAIDAYNTREPLIAYARSFGITSIHTGHAPGELISGQSMIAKTTGNTIDDVVLVETAAVMATLSEQARKSGDKSPGTRAKAIAMLRQELIAAREYLTKQSRAKEDKPVAVNLRYETLGTVLRREVPLLVTAHRAQDIANVLRLAKEFEIRIWLDGVAEAYLMLDEIKAAGVPVIVHPTMMRGWGETRNISFETASKLVQAGIPVALQSHYENYVPKTRVVLFEAALAAANGLSFEQALATITIDAAKILGVDQRIGSLEVGKDGDVSLYDGDPFEYTTHCVGVVIDGEVVSDKPR